MVKYFPLSCSGARQSTAVFCSTGYYSLDILSWIQIKYTEILPREYHQTSIVFWYLIRILQAQSVDKSTYTLSDGRQPDQTDRFNRKRGKIKTILAGRRRKSERWMMMPEQVEPGWQGMEWFVTFRYITPHTSQLVRHTDTVLSVQPVLW